MAENNGKSWADKDDDEFERVYQKSDLIHMNGSKNAVGNYVNDKSKINCCFGDKCKNKDCSYNHNCKPNLKKIEELSKKLNEEAKKLREMANQKDVLATEYISLLTEIKANLEAKSDSSSSSDGKSGYPCLLDSEKPHNFKQSKECNACVWMKEWMFRNKSFDENAAKTAFNEMRNLAKSNDNRKSIPCKFGKDCKKEGCQFNHDNLPIKEYECLADQKSFHNTRVEFIKCKKCEWIREYCTHENLDYSKPEDLKKARADYKNAGLMIECVQLFSQKK